MLSTPLSIQSATRQLILSGACLSGAHRLVGSLTSIQQAQPAASLSAVPSTKNVESSDFKSNNNAFIKEQPSGTNLEGVLTSFLEQQHAAPPASSSSHYPAAMHQAYSSPSEQLPGPACQPELPAASSGQVRMESQLVFDSCWRRFKEKHGMDFAAPREIVWLNGAPGSGKGVSTPHILKVRGMTKSICVSALLSQSPEARRYIEAGEMISDGVVGDLLLEKLLEPASAGFSTAELNTVVDGFPRTAVQVDFVKLLMDKLTRLHAKYVDTPFAGRFPRPASKVVVLYVDESTSIQRQLQRAVAARAHNIRVKDAGVGEQALHEERPTDLDLNKATKRYQIFRQHYSAILRLKQFLPFHLIDAMGSKQDTHEQITQELRYQSSLDLSEDVYSAIRHLPLAKDLQQTARQQLVSRLEGYCSQQRPLFGRVLGLMQTQVLSLLQQGALAGSAEWVTQDELFSKHPVCIDMLLDVLSDRGFKATYCREVVAVPVSFDASNGSIITRSQPQHRFKFLFEAAGERDASAFKALEIAARITEAARSNMVAAAAVGGMGLAMQQHQQQQLQQQHSQHAHHQLPHMGMAGLHPAATITESFIPEHLDHEARLRRVALAAKQQPATAAAAAGCSQGHQDCSSCSNGQDGQDAAGENVFVIHTCRRPDLQCGHSEELEVVSLAG